jgi:uncharacterized protein YggE
MKKLILISVLLIGSNAWANERTVTVQGYAEKSVIPDQAELNLSVTEEGLSLSYLKDQIADVSNAFISLTKDLGINNKDIQTTGINIQPKYRYNPKTGKRIFDGYSVSRSINVDIEDLTILGELIERSIDVGINNISSPKFKASNQSEILLGLHSLAMEDAIAKAKALLTPLPSSIGEVINIMASEGIAPNPPMPYMEMRVMNADSASNNNQSYEVGEISFNQIITATFAIEN